MTPLHRGLAVLLAAILATTPVWAQPAPAPAGPPSKAELKQAEELFARANQRYEAGEYASAADDFRAAYDLSRLSALLFNVAQAYRLDGNCTEALRYYKDYLAAEPQTSNRVDVEARIGQMERCVAEQKAQRQQPPPPEPEPLPLPPPPPPRTTVVDGPRGGGGLRTAGLTLGALGLAAGGAGVFFALKAKSAASDVSDACASECVWDDVADQDSAGRRNGRLALILWSAGGAALITGTVLFAVGMAKRGSRRVEAVTILPTPGGGVWAGVSGRF